MKLTILNLILFFFIFNEISAQLQKVYDVVVEPVSKPPNDPSICTSPCRECGKLIFTTSLPNLKFISNMGHISGTPEIEIRINSYGTQIFTYKITTKALPSQTIRISGGDIIRELNLQIPELNVGECLYYLINAKGEGGIIDGNTTEAIEKEIIKYGKNQKIWGVSSLAMAGAGGIMFLASNKKYDEYTKATSSNASDLYNTSKLYQNMGIAFLSGSGICAIGFVFPTVKKNNAKQKLKVSTNGSSAMVTFNF